MPSPHPGTCLLFFLTRDRCLQVGFAAEQYPGVPDPSPVVHCGNTPWDQTGCLKANYSEGLEVRSTALLNTAVM